MDFSSLFPNESPNPYEAYTYGATPGVGFGRILAKMLGDRMGQERSYAMELGKMSAEAKKGQLEAMQKNAEIQQKLFGDVAQLQASREANQRIYDLTPWAPRTHEEALQWYNERLQGDIQKAAAGSRPGLTLEDLLKLGISVAQNASTPPPWAGLFPGYQAPTDPLSGMKDVIGQEIERRTGINPYSNTELLGMPITP